MTQTQLAPQPAVGAITVNAAYEALQTYQREIEQVRPFIENKDYDAALAHLLQAVYALGVVVAWRSVWERTGEVWEAVARAVTSGSRRARSAVTSTVMGLPPIVPTDILAALGAFSANVALKQVRGLLKDLAMGCGARGYELQVGFPSGVTVVLVFDTTEPESRATVGKSRPSRTPR